MELKSTACALGLYQYKGEHPAADLFHRFYSTMLSFLHSVGVNPNYIGVDGDGYPDKLQKIGGRVEKKLLDTSFSGVNSLSLVANPDGSDSPAYDAFMSTSVGFVESAQELLLSFVINESFVKLRSPEYDRLLRSQVELCRWDFGYGFSSSVEKQPDFHILGVDNGKLSAEEYKSLSTWYAAPGEVRTALLRDVYPYNLLNENQLDSQVSDGVTLRQFAQRQPGCALTRLTDDGLHLWQVPDAEVARLRKVLVGSPVLMS